MVAVRLSWTGVVLFFVLSGFLIGGILLAARPSTNYFQIFYTRRFFRIVPIYVALLLVFSAFVFAAQRMHNGDFTWLTADRLPWYSFWTFTQNFWMAHTAGLGASGLAVTWSLAVEEQFYLTLPLVVRFLFGRWLLACVMTGIGLAPLARIAIRQIWPQNWVATTVLMPCRADALLFGVLAAVLIRDDVWKARIQRNNLFFAISIPALLLGIVFLTLKAPGSQILLMQRVGYTWLALFYVQVLLYSVTRPDSLVSYALRFKSLGWPGSLAYRTYLLHQTIQRPPRHSLEARLRSPISPLRRKKDETFWALKAVSLEVREGEVLGLIGRNGAGKTTLLKILSRITRPTTGWAEIHGRVGSLLEVGTGFHPELTGRENTYLSGAILGMGKAEIARKFDEIVAFAQLG